MNQSELQRRAPGLPKLFPSGEVSAITAYFIAILASSSLRLGVPLVSNIVDALPKLPLPAIEQARRQLWFVADVTPMEGSLLLAETALRHERDPARVS